MNSQKGSVKDRIRARIIFLEYKRSKHKKEQELAKKKNQEYEAKVKAEQIRIYGKPYSKTKAFFLSVIGLLIELITPKGTKNSIKRELDLLEKEKQQVFLRLEQDKDVNEVYNSIDKTYQKLEDLKQTYKKRLIFSSFSPMDKDNLLQKIDEKQRELIVINEICHNKENQNKKTNALSEKINISQKINEQNKTLDKERVTGIINIDKESLKSNKEDVQVTINSSQLALSSIKNMTTNIKEYTKEFETIKEKVQKEELYNTLFDFEFKLKQLLIRLKKIYEDYELLDEQFDLELLEKIIDIDVIDKYELRKNNKSILKRIEDCNNLLREIESKKQDLSIKKEIIQDNKLNEESKTNKEVKKEIKSKKYEEDKKELEEQFDDIYLANKIIINNIMEEKKMVEKLNKKLNNQSPLNKKKIVFMHAKRFTNSILNFGFSLLPIKYFRNRMLGTLVSGIMINNSLRTTRRILTFDNYKDNYILYNSIINEIKSNEDYISKIYDTCLDSQSQIRSIREHLNVNFSMLRDYDSELLEFHKQLDSLYNDLELQLNSLDKISRKYANVRQKIKVREGRY